MAQTGYTPIQLYSSSTPGNAPAAGDLSNTAGGSELAINIADGKLFYKDSGGNVQVIGWKLVPVSAGGTGQTSYTDGQLLIGNSTGNTLTKATLTAGTGISITNGAGAITISATGGTGTVTSVSGTAPISVANGTTTPVISISQAGVSTNGYLSSTDWNTFNNKGSGSVTSVSGTGTVNGLTLTGTVTSSGSLTLGGTLDLSSPPTIGNITPNTGKFTSVTSPYFDASTSAGGALRNASGVNQLQWGAGGGNNITVDVAININPANAQVDISPTGTGTVKVNPTAVGNIDNMVIGATTPKAITGTTITATTFSGSGASLTSIPNSALNNSTISGVALGSNLFSLAAGTGVTFSTGTTYNGSAAITINATGSGGTVTSVAALTLGTTGTDLSSTVANSTTTPVITLNVPTASATNRGALSSTDWSTFNGKQAALVSGTNIKTVGGVSLLGSGDVGTIGTGYGGTGLTSFTANGIVYASGTGTLATGSGLRFNGSTTLSLGNITDFAVNGGDNSLSITQAGPLVLAGSTTNLAGNSPKIIRNTVVGSYGITIQGNNNTTVNDTYPGAYISIGGGPLTDGYEGNLSLVAYGNTAGVTRNVITFSTRSGTNTIAERARINSNGQFCIGATAGLASESLYVYKNNSMPIIAQSDAIPGSFFYCNTTGATNNILIDNANGYNYGVMGVVSATGSNGGTVYGLGYINTAGSAFNPVMKWGDATSTIGLGSATPSTSGTGITFPATASLSTDVNTLDDYEEGTWTGVLGGATSQSGQAYSNQACAYTKIGRLVTVSGYIRCTTPGTITGNAVIRGLPFPCAAGANFYSSCQILDFSGMGVNTVSIMGTISSTLQYISIYYKTTASAGYTAAANTLWQSGTNPDIAFCLTYTTDA